MSDNDFTTAARAEADEYGKENAPTIGTMALVTRAHLHGWEAARDHLAAQEPTDAEVEAVARKVFEYDAPSHEPDEWFKVSDALRWDYRGTARAALLAARVVRQGN